MSGMVDREDNFAAQIRFSTVELEDGYKHAAMIMAAGGTPHRFAIDFKCVQHGTVFLRDFKWLFAPVVDAGLLHRFSIPLSNSQNAKKHQVCYTVSMTGSATVAFTLDKVLGIWTAYIPDVPAYGEGKTKEAALTDLKEAVALYIEEAGEKAFQDHLAPATEYKKVPLRIFA